MFTSYYTARKEGKEKNFLCSCCWLTCKQYKCNCDYVRISGSAYLVVGHNDNFIVVTYRCTLYVGFEAPPRSLRTVLPQPQITADITFLTFYYLICCQEVFPDWAFFLVNVILVFVDFVCFLIIIFLYI